MRPWRTRSRLADELIRPAHGAGRPRLERRRLDVYQEHRATRIVESALMDLIAQGRARPVPPGAPLALGATPEGDLYTLAGLLCELALRELGWDVINLGSNLPLASLAKAVRVHRPRLVWLSINHLADPERFVREYDAFYDAAAASGAAVILGGPALDAALRARLVAASFGERIAHLAEFARRLARRRGGAARTDALTRTTRQERKRGTDAMRYARQRHRRRRRPDDPGRARHRGPGPRRGAGAPPGPRPSASEARRGARHGSPARRADAAGPTPRPWPTTSPGYRDGDGPTEARLGAVFRRYSELRGKLALANMRLVAHVAKRFRDRGDRLLRPAPGGVLRPARGDRPLRPDARDQAGHLRHLVDPPGDAAGRRRRAPTRSGSARGTSASSPRTRRSSDRVGDGRPADGRVRRDDPADPHGDPADRLARRHARHRRRTSACSRR